MQKDLNIVHYSQFFQILIKIIWILLLSTFSSFTFAVDADRGDQNFDWKVANGLNSAADYQITVAHDDTRSLDIDGNLKYDALTDGLLILRYMFGLTGDALIGGSVPSNARYTASGDVESRITLLGDLADIDGDGRIDALTDGLLILRYLFGLEGDALVSGLVVEDAIRLTAPDIEAHLKNLMPAIFIDVPDPIFADALTRLGYTVTNGKMAAETALSIEMLCITSLVGYFGEPDANNTAIFDNPSVPDFGVRCSYTDGYITDTTGLESFLNLKTMRFEHQRIETIHLSSLRSLFYLSLWRNPLSSLDVSKNIELTHLGLSETSLTSIDTSNLAKLENAEFQHGVSASSLPVTMNPGVTVYGFSSLDFSGNQQIRRVYLHGNPLTDFGLSQNKDTLKELWANNTSIESLDLSDYANLNYIILYNSPNLSFLNLSGVDHNTVPWRLQLIQCPSLEEVIVHNVDEYLAAIQNEEIGVDSHITFIEES